MAPKPVDVLAVLDRAHDAHAHVGGIYALRGSLTEAKREIAELLEASLCVAVHAEDYRDGTPLRNEQEVARVAADARRLRAAIAVCRGALE